MDLCGKNSAMQDFLSQHGYEIVQAIPQDASSRHYYRVAKGGAKNRAILMVDNPAETRVGYRIQDFIQIAKWLNQIGLNAPDIYELDEAQGFVLLQDLGAVDFKQAIERGHDRAELYGLAHDVLHYLSDKVPPFELPDYHKSHIHAGHQQILDWYVPAVRREKNPDGLVEEYWRIWEGIEAQLPPCPRGFMHIDYHVENMILCPDEAGVKRLGLLDFQAGMMGPRPYDLVNLLEDARINVPQDIQDNILNGYDEDFKAWYRILGTQFHSRVIGLFVKLPVMVEKTKYLEHLPRLQNYIYQGLQDPILSPIKAFFNDLGVDFNESDAINISDVMTYITDENLKS